MAQEVDGRPPEDQSSFTEIQISVIAPPVSLGRTRRSVAPHRCQSMKRQTNVVVSGGEEQKKVHVGY